MVNYLTCIVFNADIEAEFCSGLCAESAQIRELGTKIQQRLHRIAAMTELLSAKGFMLQIQGLKILAFSDTVEAQDAKVYLREQGYQDHEFQVRLEYSRQWGIM